MAEKKSTESKNKKSGTSKKSTEKSSSASKKTARKSSTKANVNRVVKAAKKYDAERSVKDNSEAIAGIVAATATSAKRASNKKQKKIFTVLAVLLIIAVIAVAIYGYFHGWFDTVVKPPLDFNSETYNAAAIKNENVSVHFLELGNQFVGDSVFIKVGDVDILIDAGSRTDSADTVTEYINQYVTDNKLEYVIATHAHEDHLAGFYSNEKVKGIFENFKVDVLIDFPKSAKTFNGAVPASATVLGKYIAARDKLIASGTAHYTADQCFNEEGGAKRVYELQNGVTLEILYNYYYFNYNVTSGGKIDPDENNYSVCCMINDGDSHYLFTGDMEAEGEEKMVDYYNNGNDKNLPKLPHCQLYKAGHHGSGTSSSEALLSAVTPDYICICTCAGTSEYTDKKQNQFPYQVTVDRIAPYTDCVYITTVVDHYVSSGWSKEGTVKSMNGNIVFAKTGDKVTLYFSNNGLKLKETDWFKENRTCPDEWK